MCVAIRKRGFDCDLARARADKRLGGHEVARFAKFMRPGRDLRAWGEPRCG